MQVGFDALYFSRIDYQDRAKRKDLKTLEIVWRGSRSLGSSADVFDFLRCHLCCFLNFVFRANLALDMEFFFIALFFFANPSHKFYNFVQIFTGIFPQNYEPPPGDFYFEVNDVSPVIQVILLKHFCSISSTV